MVKIESHRDSSGIVAENAQTVTAWIHMHHICTYNNYCILVKKSCLIIPTNSTFSSGRAPLEFRTHMYCACRGAQATSRTPSLGSKKIQRWSHNHKANILYSVIDLLMVLVQCINKNWTLKQLGKISICILLSIHSFQVLLLNQNINTLLQN